MTSTVTPAPPPPTAGAPDTAAARRAGSEPVRTLQPAAELALLALTLAVVYGFRRVFVGTGFLGPLVAVAAAGHATAWVTRRRGWSVPVAALASAASFAVVSSWVFFWDSTAMGLPTPGTLDAASAALRSSWQSFQTVVAPVPPQTGFLLASAVGIAFAVFLADWAAFRLWSTIEAVVPAATLFVFCALLGSEQHRLDSTVAFVTTFLLFWLLHRTARRETSGWLPGTGGEGSRSLVRTGVALTAVAVLASVLIGPQLPGADRGALLSWRKDDKGPSSRVTISPMVNLKERLVNQSQIEVFTVRSNERSYWRLTALDTFDGTIWKSGGSYGSASGELPHTDLPAGTGQVESAQDYDITGLSALWVPAAFEPRRVEGAKGLRFQPESSTLIVDTNRTDSDGLRYSVTSVLPRFTPDELRNATAPAPPELSRYLELPADFSERATRTAQRVTQGARTPYDQALALQNWFAERGGFTYSLDVPAGHSDNAIDAFLQARQGYCEQFAGTFAAMARSLGIPARVAVGFTPGEQDPADPQRYIVRGEHAHAWPEVWLGQYGWVPFEPTPSRGAPGAEAWTGRPEAQVVPGQPESTSTTSSTSTTAPSASSTTVAPSLPDQQSPLADTTGRDTRTGADEGGPNLFVRLGQLVVALAVLAALALALGALTTAILHRRRRAQAYDPSARVRVAWAEAVDTLALLGAGVHPSDTHDEVARLAAPLLGDGAPALRALADAADAATFAPDLVDPATADRAQAARDEVEAYVRRTVPRRRRLWAACDPRPLLGKRPPTRQRASLGLSVPTR